MKHAKKIQTNRSERSKAARRPGALKISKPKPSADKAEGAVRWEEEIHALSGERFGSVSEATSAVIDRVLDRMYPRSGREPQGGSIRDAKEIQEAKEFLTLLFETDPTISDHIERLLVVKR